MNATTLNRVFSWPFTLSLAGLLAPFAYGLAGWLDTALSALPAATVIVASVALGCRARTRPLSLPVTLARCAWATVVTFGILGPVVLLARTWFSDLQALPLLLLAAPIGVAVTEIVDRGVTAFDRCSHVGRSLVPAGAVAPLPSGAL